MKRAFALFVALLSGLWIFGPYEPVEMRSTFDAARFGEGVQVYFESAEAQFDDIKPGSEKRVVWIDGFQEQRTPFSIVYLHGFSANAEEIRPVPDLVAAAIGANLVFTRFTGHGRTNDALGEVTVGDWMEDVAEAMAAGRAVGERVIVIATSTGGTLAAEAVLQPALAEGMAGIVFVSPNFGIQNAMAPLLTWPAARYWLPLVAGERRSFEPLNAAQAQHWTTEYPSVAVFPMAALVKDAAHRDYTGVAVPALFYYSNKDKVVEPKATAMVQQKWGAETRYVAPGESGSVDPFLHVVAGDIMSPANTDAAVAVILDWVEDLP